MTLLDSKGRLFGKLSLLDIGAALIILAVIFGTFVFPGTTGSIAQGGGTQPVEVSAVVRGLSVRDPEELIQAMREAGKTKVIIRNQPHDEVEIAKIEPIERLVVVPQPDGSVKALPDPRTQEESLSMDMIISFRDRAQITDDGVVIGGQKVKIGTLLEFEGEAYNFKGSAIEVTLVE
ncbi:MAG: DUF4330 domain-containing protein [Jaaginema sp. PMC 1079.18]|nr:DUF4330 domain-containing protein [Jaaginema sp. PMC 1080.18]MEC4851954.1 DUF4330 domain-containing protein [Jaaginema sp. PMC 1079.18]MEC4868480.1 DUF4330 domain-containing protein [Jaaginema sp. PMC 1078.18]